MNAKYNGWCKCCNLPVSSCKNRGEAKRGDTSPIFEPGDFVFPIGDPGFKLDIGVYFSEMVNAKLQSLGIDAEFLSQMKEMPEKLKRLRAIEETPVIQQGDLIVNFDTFVRLSSREKVVECLRQMDSRGQRLEQRLSELEKMIAEAPEIRGYMLGDTFYQHCVHSVIYEHSISHRARLVQIEVIKDGKDNK